LYISLVSISDEAKASTEEVLEMKELSATDIANFEFKTVEISKIKANPQNPRGIPIREKDQKFALLKDSIAQFGILVPLVVSPENDHYKLIDGERRFLAAKDLGLKDVPAYVASKTLADKDILLRMFHIHHNREQWEPIPQCGALEARYNQIAERKAIQKLSTDEAKVQAIAKALADEIGIELNLARDRVLFLRWPSDIKERLYRNPNKDYLYINEIEKHIILPALANYPEYFQRVSVDEVRRFLYKKLLAKVVGKKISVRDAVPIVRFETHKPTEKKKVLRIFDELVKDPKMTFQDARDEFFREFPNARTISPPSPRKLLTLLITVQQSIEVFDINSFKTSVKRAKAGRRDVVKALEKLVEALQELKERISR